MMKPKCKIFIQSGFDNKFDLEDEINTFLDRNPGIEIVKVSQSYDSRKAELVVIVFYKIPNAMR